MCPLTIRARDVMQKDVVVINASETVATAIKTMLEKNVWSLVVSKGGLPVGFVTERDLIRRCFAKGLDPEHSHLESIMSSPLITAGPDTPLIQIMALMTEKNIRRVYIVDEGQIMGRITQTGAFAEVINVMMSISGIL
ncbi:MAG TPA: CBS domain-containing protein [Candidatus Bathyarchaeia archaeon]|nr:CBS domain-containing protein [Candidatus Bathyarchaeia archaeon]